MKRLVCLLLFLIAYTTYSQNPGDQVFGEDQVITVELQFSQPGFWDSLLLNYETETYMMAALTITDNSGTASYSSVGVRLKGNSSFGHPGNKKSFKIDFNRYVDSLEYDGLKKINFNNCFKDPTFMHEKIYYDICESAQINAPRANYANVYMNDTFWGFYSLVEQVDDEFLKTRFDDKSENLFKAGDAFGMGGGSNAADLSYYGTDQSSYEGKYTLENNTDENNWNDLIDLVDFINNSTDEEFVSGLSQHFNVPQLMNSLVMYNAFSNLDSYLNSARNYYIYDKDSSGVWEWINWDCNEAFGTYSGGPGGDDLTMMDLYYYTFERPLYERILTLDDTRSTYAWYYCQFKDQYFNAAYIDSAVNSLYTLISDDVYADYNKMYSNSDFETNLDYDITGGGMGGTIYGIRTFVDRRVAYLDGVLECVMNSISETDPQQFSIYPNPAADFLYFTVNGNDFNYSIFNAAGESVSTGKGVAEAITFVDVHNLPYGFYLLKIISGGHQYTSTFVKN